MKVLYVSYDGVLEPLGQSQVLGYLEKLVVNREIVLISYEKAADWAQTEHREAMQRRIVASGIQWVPLRYHKRPSALATAYDVGVGVAVGAWLVVRHRIGIVHARSYVASLVALALKKLLRLRYLFDMRGFWADERVDGGIWPREGRLYRIAKWFERRFLLEADYVVSLTKAAVRIMESFPYLAGQMPRVAVIPTCADLDRFRPGEAREGPFVLGYVGSAGTWYEFDAAVACFSALLRVRPDARFLIINRNEHEYIRDRLAAGGVPPGRVELRAARHGEVPGLIARMDAGVFFYRPSFSRAACAPTKLGEFLGCGVPCLANAGVGDTAEILEGGQVGIVVDDLSPDRLMEGLARLLRLLESESVRDRCVEAARRHFSLSGGVAAYEHVYHDLEDARA